MNAPTRHKRGDLSPCGTKRFWQYQKHVSKKTGKPCERWIPVHNFDNYRIACYSRTEVAQANSEFIKAQQAKAKAKNK